jgi:nonsense-mediated mRNA decay protein 3
VNEYGAELKESSTLVGRKDDGSDMYRVTYLVRLPVYKQGDVVLQNDVPHHIVTLSKNGIKLLNLRDFRIQTVKPADMRALKVIRKREEVQDAVVVNAGEGEAQVLHPGNFRTVDIRLPPGFQAGETVRVVEHEGEILLIP